MKQFIRLLREPLGLLAGAALDTAKNVAPSLVGAGMGLLLQKGQDKRQIRQQQKLQDMQIKGQQQMAEFNRAQQLKLWEETGYKAQIKQMNEAGLNPALLYGMSGGGAQTAAAQPGNVNAGHAPVGGGEIQAGIAMGLQSQMMAAQIELTKANAAKVKAEIPNVGLTGKNIEASTQSILQHINNAKAQEEYTKTMTSWQQLETNFANQTFKARAANIEATLDQTLAKIKEIGLANNFTEQTWNDALKQVQQNAIGAELHNELLKVQKTAAEAGINLTNAQIMKISADIAQGWKALGLQELQGMREDQRLKQSELQLLYNEMKTKFEIEHPGLWNVIGGTAERTIKQAVEDIKDRIRFWPKMKF